MAGNVDRFAVTARRIEALLQKRLFFVCGVLKSGTTWLERLLDVHPRVVCKGEAHFGSDILRPLREVLDGYNADITRKGGVVAHLKEYGGATDVLAYDPDDTSFLATAAVALMLHKWVVDESVECVGDKTPGNLQYMPQLAELFPEAKFVHIIRDGRDVAVSLWHFNLMTDIGRTIRSWGTFENFATEFAGTWSEQITAGRAAGRALGDDRYLEVGYEKLVAEGDVQLAHVFRFLGVDASAETVSHCLEACSFERLSGGRRQGEEDADSFYRKGIAGDWKNHFKPGLAEEFRANSNGLLRELGYAD